MKKGDKITIEKLDGVYFVDGRETSRKTVREMLMQVIDMYITNDKTREHVSFGIDVYDIDYEED